VFSEGLKLARKDFLFGRQRVLKFLNGAAEAVEINADDFSFNSVDGRGFLAGRTVFGEIYRADALHIAVFVNRADFHESAVSAVNFC
jgi:hypothetical protein